MLVGGRCRELTAAGVGRALSQAPDKDEVGSRLASCRGVPSRALLMDV
jgi:hypothetical protein